MGRLSTHVLDTARGQPAAGIAIRLYSCNGDDRRLLKSATTNADGRTAEPLLQGGNLRGFYPARTPGAPRVILGSHLDTVPHAGAFDGILGVVMGIAIVDALAPLRMSFGIEVVGFSEEEGVRFGVPFIGSRALAGTVDETLLALRDSQGLSVADAIRSFGLDPARLPEARLADNALGYLEFHIEQGPVLESLNYPLGVVQGIVGQSRFNVTFTGKAGHAGTTPMKLRHDELAGAAEWIALVENMAKGFTGLI